MSWLSYQSAVRAVDGLHRDLHTLAEQRGQRFRDAAGAHAEFTGSLAAQQQRISDVGRRLSMHGDLFARATPPEVSPRDAARDMRLAAEERAACDRKLAEVETLGSRSPFLPNWPRATRSVLISAPFAVLPVLAVTAVDLSGTWPPLAWAAWWAAAVVLAAGLAALTYRKLCTPPIRLWAVSEGKNTRKHPATRLHSLAYLVCGAPSALVLLAKGVLW